MGKDKAAEMNSQNWAMMDFVYFRFKVLLFIVLNHIEWLCTLIDVQLNVV